MKSILQFKSTATSAEWIDCGQLRLKNGKQYLLTPITKINWHGIPVPIAYRVQIETEFFYMDYSFWVDVLSPDTSSWENELEFRIRSTDFAILSRQKTSDVRSVGEYFDFPAPHGFTGGEMVMLKGVEELDWNFGVPKKASPGGIYYIDYIDADTVRLLGYVGGSVVQIIDGNIDIVEFLEIAMSGNVLDKINIGTQNYQLFFDQQRDRNTYEKHKIRLDFVVGLEQYYTFGKWLSGY